MSWNVVGPLGGVPVVFSVLFVAAAFAGCVGEDEQLDPGAALDGACDADDAIAGQVTPGGIRLEPATATVTAPALICLTNLDGEPHTIRAVAQELDMVPAWAPPLAAAGGHGHGGGHDHGGDGGDDHGASEIPVPDVFRHTIGPGATVRVNGITFHGLLFVVDVDWPDLRATWEIRPNATVAYPVAVHEAMFESDASGDTTAGTTTATVFEVAAPNLARIDLELRWDDAEDDGMLGEAANQPDEVAIRIIDPGGETVAEHVGTKRTAIVTIEHLVETVSFPASIDGQGLTDAAGVLASAHPDDISNVGSWTVEVEVLNAPGAAPDPDGSTQGVPEVGDGHQTWTLDITFTHAFATLGSFGSTPASGMYHGRL